MEIKSFKAQSSTIDTALWFNKVLVVAFVSGAVYAYRNVPEVVYYAFEQAPSKGRFFSQEIGNRFDTIKLT